MAENKYKILFFIMAFLCCFELGIYTGLGIHKIQQKKSFQTYLEKVIPNKGKTKKLILINC